MRKRGLFSPCINRLGKSRETCTPSLTFPSDLLLFPFLSWSLPLTTGGAHTPSGNDTEQHTHTHMQGEITPPYLWIPFPIGICIQCVHGRADVETSRHVTRMLRRGEEREGSELWASPTDSSRLIPAAAVAVVTGKSQQQQIGNW